MGNMLPSLVQACSSILPPIDTKQWSHSMKILARTLCCTTKRPHRSNNNRVKAAARRETSAADQGTPRTRRGLTSGNSNQNRRRVVRVKVVLTRVEAARLMFLAEHGDKTATQVVGELKRLKATSSSQGSAAQAIRELKRMEVLITRANSFASASAAWRPVLDSIAEE
ncbi:hypothetical protein BS78_09G084600 [Paspalum vaginatum]|nr:hypothetical protein BS78_09G084600 [Paspalum vaginatum]